MTTTQHTPTPWRFYKATNRNRFEVVTVAINTTLPPDCKTPAAHIASMHYSRHVDLGASMQEAEAHARLFVAAPKLLLAAKEAALFLSEIADTFNIPPDVKAQGLARLMNAIAKAEGAEGNG